MRKKKKKTRDFNKAFPTHIKGIFNKHKEILDVEFSLKRNSVI